MSDLGARQGGHRTPSSARPRTSPTSTRAATTPRSGAACARARSRPTPGLAGGAHPPGVRLDHRDPARRRARRGRGVMRQLYELAARTDCENVRRLQNLDMFIIPVRNPDGRDATPRATAWGFDPNRDFGTREPGERRRSRPRSTSTRACSSSTPTSRATGTSSRPTRTRSTTRSRTSRSTSSRTTSGRRCSGVQRPVDYYRNYNSYDLFTPEYGDTVPALLDGAAGHDLREGQQRDLRQAGLRPLPGHGRDGERHVRPEGRHPHRLGQAVGRGGRAGRASASCSRTSSSARCTRRCSSQQPDTASAATTSCPDAHRRHGAADARAASTGVHVYRLERRRPSPASYTRSAPTPATRPDAAGRDALDPDGPGPEALDPGDPRREPVPPVPVQLRRHRPGRTR